MVLVVVGNKQDSLKRNVICCMKTKGYLFIAVTLVLYYIKSMNLASLYVSQLLGIATSNIFQELHWFEIVGFNLFK